MPALHVPDEPVAHRARWFDSVVEGADLGRVISGPDGVAQWLWTRWRVLAQVGLSDSDLSAIALTFRREIWLWLAGERTWAHCCSGLIGRIGRRIAL